MSDPTVDAALPDWRRRARRLADELTDRGVLDDPRWPAAVCETPRHALVPRWYVQGDDARWRTVARDDPATATEWADGIYRNAPLVTALGDDHEPASSSSQPSLMVRMLAALDLHDHHRVLEIGTGTGYNAALLTHRLGDTQVHTIDLDPQLTGPAQEHLAALGRCPRIATRNGAAGWPEHAPYDRIIATCSVPRIPPAWAAQTTPDGLVLADLKIGAGTGTLVLLRHSPDGLTGRFLPAWAGFMAMRPASTASRPPEPAAALRLPPSTVTDERLAPDDLPRPLSLVEEFLAALDLPDNHLRRTVILDPHTLAPVAERYTTGDGSWCEIDRVTTADARRPRSARSAGPTPLVEILRASREQWLAAGEPGWDGFAVTVTPDNHHHIRLDAGCSRTWALPDRLSAARPPRAPATPRPRTP